MSEPARKVLEALLKRAERARLRQDSSNRAITCAFTEKGFSAYHEQPTAEAIKDIHAYLREAERADAITIKWDRQAGDDGQILSITLTGDETLAGFLRITPYWDTLGRALDKLAPWRSHPGVARFTKKWREYKSYRNIGAEDVDKVVDALKVINAAGNTPNTPARRLSAQLFQDTKRVETLIGIIDELTREDDMPITVDLIEVTQRIGLIRHPQPLLLAGTGRIRLGLDDGESHTHDIAAPYIGVDPDSFVDIQLPNNTLGLLTVENLTTFHELARIMPANVPGLIAYTGGMPSPAFRRVYQMLCNRLPDGARIWHWGDIDQGGFRAAMLLKRDIEDLPQPLEPWRMNPDELPESALYYETKGENIPAMIGLCKALGWYAIATALEVQPVTVEQEILEPTLPF